MKRRAMPEDTINGRLQALKILTALLANHVSLSQSMSDSALSPMAKELCFGVCRHYFRLETIANCLLTKKPKTIEIWVVLLLGLYELHYMHTPDYAVVKETVALLDRIKKIWAKGLINAVLRTFCRKHEEIIASLAEDQSFIYGHPEHLLSHMKKDWPNDWPQIALANDAHPPMILRVNKKQKSVLEYLDLLHQAGMEAIPHPVAPEGIVLKDPCDVHDLPGFAKGWVSIQDGAAQLAASLLDLKPGLRVLDACCAPGGKTCHILESEPKLQECVALDSDPRRLKRVTENLTRLGLEALVQEGDALDPQSWWNGQYFDRILLDAPCSATGVIRRHADIKLLRNNEDIHIITTLQHDMIRALWPLLAIGGLMVYATCSIISEENENQLAKFISNQSDCKQVAIRESWGRDTGHGRQILPGELSMDGFFYSVLLKVA